MLRIYINYLPKSMNTESNHWACSYGWYRYGVNPFLITQPGMGIAISRTPNPNLARAKVIVLSIIQSLALVWIYQVWQRIIFMRCN